MSESILQRTKKCWVCGKRDDLECHHVFYGRAYRHLSEKYGMKVWLCSEHHRGRTGVHGGNRDLGLRLMRYAQRKFEETHTREEFMSIFGRNRLIAEEKNKTNSEESDGSPDVYGSSIGMDIWNGKGL